MQRRVVPPIEKQTHRIHRSGDPPSQKRDPSVNSSGTGPNNRELGKGEIRISSGVPFVTLNGMLRLPDDGKDDERMKGG